VRTERKGSGGGKREGGEGVGGRGGWEWGEGGRAGNG